MATNRFHVMQEDRRGAETLVRCCASPELAGVERDRVEREAEHEGRFLIAWVSHEFDCGHP